MILYSSFLSEPYGGQWTKTCFSSSTADFCFFFLQIRQNLSSRGVLLNLPVSTANLRLLIVIVVYQTPCILFDIESRYPSIPNLFLKDIYVSNFLKLVIVLDQYILHYSQRKFCNNSTADGSSDLPFYKFTYIWLVDVTFDWRHVMTTAVQCNGWSHLSVS